MAMTADDFILNEYKARQLWERRDYTGAMDYTRSAAETAASRGDDAGWWRMTYLLAECQRELGLMGASAETARQLIEHPLSFQDPELAGKAKALRSLGLRSIGQLPEALEIAREATLNFPETGYGSKGKLEAQQVLVAVLAESGNMDDAWHEAQVLANMIDEGTESDKAGKAYWSIGNVAFLLGRNEEATHFHDLAAECIHPSNDVNLWARFNKASAFMRLTANLLDEKTLQCIERAEMALSISGGSPHDELDISVIRAHWRYVVGDVGEAREQMDHIMQSARSMTPLSEGDARVLYARILLATGDSNSASNEAAIAIEVFDKVGAVTRAEQARQLLSEIGPLNG